MLLELFLVHCQEQARVSNKKKASKKELNDFFCFQNILVLKHFFIKEIKKLKKTLSLNALKLMLNMLS